MAATVSDAGWIRPMLAAAARVLCSVLGGVVTYGVWLVAVLASRRGPPAPFPFALLMVTAPATALGLTLGSLLGERLTHRPRSGLLLAFLWPLVGCTVGALVVYPFGPMLIVFGVFALGTAAVAAREIWTVATPPGGRGSEVARARRSRARRAFLLLVAVTPLGLLAADLGSRSASPDKRGTRLVTVNVDTRPLEIAEALSGLQPDIVLMQETAGSCAPASRALGLHFEDGSDQCILSRWPLSSAPVQWPGPWQPPQLSTTASPFANLALVNARLAIPVAIAALATLGNQWYTERQRRDQWAGLRKLLGASRPALVCGDFNALPLEVDLGAGLRDAWLGPSYGATFPARLPAARIDQCWATTDVTIRRTLTLPVRSDHRALVVDFEIGGGR